MTALEFLLLNGAKADVKDDRGQSPLHHASMLGRTGQVCQLLKRNANQNAFDDQHRVSAVSPSFLSWAVHFKVLCPASGAFALATRCVMFIVFLLFF